MLRLIVPKNVELNNFRLKVLFNVLQISTLVLLCVRFFEARLWVRSMPIADHMSADLWVKPGGADRISEVWREKVGSPVCVSPGEFDFSWGGEDGAVFAGHECLPPCSVTGSRERCIHEMETHRREADDQVFFVTQFEERRTDASESSFAFVPIEEAHSIGLRYSYSVPYPWWLASFSASQLQTKLPTDGLLKARSDGNGSERENILTVLLSHDESGGVESVHRIVEPHAVLDIPLPELLEMAGERGMMDSPNADAGPNSHEGAQHAEGGLARITGMNLDIHIECYQSQLEPLPDHENWVGPVCYAKVTKNPTKPWATWEHVEALGSDGTMRQRLHHGVRARVIMEGYVDVFDANSLFLQFTASLVFLALPRQFMYFFINYTLGHLSTIYRGVIIELFDVQMECARLTARLMSNSVTFVELEDVKPDRGKDVGCISRRRVEEQLRKVLRYRGATLDEAEINGVVHFCHEAMMHSETLCRRAKPLHQLKAAIMEKMPTRQSSFFRNSQVQANVSNDDTISSGVITIDAFSMCCAATSQLEFESFVRLFDKDRGVTVLEHLFLPPKLKPTTLLLDGQKCRRSGATNRRSLFNLHRRRQQKMDMLQHFHFSPPKPPSLRSRSADLLPSRSRSEDLRPIAVLNLQAPPGTSPALERPFGSPPTLDDRRQSEAQKATQPTVPDIAISAVDVEEVIAPLSPLRTLGSNTLTIRAVDVEEDDAA